MNCHWCDSPMPTGKPRRFCSTAHRQAYHSACRKFTAAMIRQGFITRETLVRRYGQPTQPCTPATAASDTQDIGNHTRALAAPETRRMG